MLLRLIMRSVSFTFVMCFLMLEGVGLVQKRLIRFRTSLNTNNLNLDFF